MVEVRIGFADLLFRLGMADRAVSLLDGVDELDWHGRRVYALALAQYSVQTTGADGRGERRSRRGARRAR